MVLGEAPIALRSRIEGKLASLFRPPHPLIEPIIKGQVDRQSLMVGNQPAEIWVADVVGLIIGKR